MSEALSQIDQYLDYFFAFGPFWVYLAIFVACFVENLFPPFPGDTFILAGGGLVAIARLDLFLTAGVILAGGLSSVMILYYFGRGYGRAFFVKKDYRYFSALDIANMERRFTRWGGLILIFSRFIVGVRSALAIVAGIGRYQAGKMFLFSLISYLLFGGLLMYISIKLVENSERIVDLFRTYNTVVWPLVALVVIGFVVAKVVSVRKRG